MNVPIRKVFTVEIQDDTSVLGRRAVAADSAEEAVRIVAADTRNGIQLPYAIESGQASPMRYACGSAVLYV